MFFGHEAEVLVVGAGPVGLMSGLMLAERGVSVEVIDAEASADSRNYALTLHPASLRLLDDIGLANELLAQGTRIDEVGFWDATGVRARLHLGELHTEFPFLLTVPRLALEQALEKRLSARKVPVHRGYRLTELRAAGGHVSCTVEKLGTDSGGYGVQTTMEVVKKVQQMSPRFVIGADGFFSTVRRRLELEVDRAGPAQGYAPTEFSTDFELKGEMRVVLDEHGVALLLPLPGGRCRFTTELEGDAIPPDDSPYLPLGTRLFPSLPVERFEAALRQRAPWYRAERTDISWAGRVRFEPCLARRFGVGRAWLAGDAAHVTGPVGAQSMNEGLREAHDLGSRLARILKSGGSLALLEQYHAQRTAEWQGLLGFKPVLEATASTDLWVARNLPRIIRCLPVTGADRTELARQLELREVARQ